ncbi:MAG TPA: low specificity L-threonine aldolase, partial [Rhodobacteraceae bacterium]|nr:low specificity L-threonine aldolase [Paracoccaceae bacterium]
MNFLSDNVHGLDGAILKAMAGQASGTASSYGEDELTGKVEARFRDIFECDLRVFAVTTGTAANALSLSLY